MDIVTRVVKVYIWTCDESGKLEYIDIFDYPISYKFKLNKRYKTVLDAQEFVDGFNLKYKANINHNDLTINNMVDIPFITEIFIHKKHSKMLYRELKFKKLLNGKS